MKSKNQIIQELYDTDFVQKYSSQKYFGRGDINDVTQEIWVIICSQPEERLQDLYEQGGINKVRQFVAGIICRQCRSVNSVVYYKYDKGRDKLISIDDPETKIEI